MKNKIPVGPPLIISLVIIVIMVVNIPIGPENHSRSTNTNPEFNWVGFATIAFVDDNPEFTSPARVEKNKKLALAPGEYYWKTEMLSPINKFNIDSEIVLEIEEQGGIKKVKNIGNIEIILEFFKNIGITGKVIVDLNESYDINDSNITEIIASQY